MKGKRIWLRAAAAVAVAAFLAGMTLRLISGGGAELSAPGRKKYAGVVTLWHVVGFKPYRGSVSNVLAEAAKRVERANYGVFFDVAAITPEEHALRISRGERPDILSFPAGLVDGEGFLPLEAGDYPLRQALLSTGVRDGALCAIPYAITPMALVENNDLARKLGLTLPEGNVDGPALLAAAQGASPTEKAALFAGDAVALALLGGRGEAASIDAFKEGKAAAALWEVRLGAELAARNERGKGFPYTLHGAEGCLSKAQYIGVSDSIGQSKQPYAELLLSAVVGDKVQAKLAALGLAPVLPMEEGWLSDPALPIDPVALCESAMLPNAFLLHRYRDALEDAARRAMAGDAGAKKELDERLKELVQGAQIK